MSLKREYVQFAKSYFNFEKLIKLPEKLHDDESDEDEFKMKIKISF